MVIRGSIYILLSDLSILYQNVSSLGLNIRCSFTRAVYPNVNTTLGVFQRCGEERAGAFERGELDV